MKNILVTFEIAGKGRTELERRIGKRAKLYYLSLMEENAIESVIGITNVLLCVGLEELKEDQMRRMERLELVQTLMAGADHLPFHAFPPSTKVCTTSGADSDNVAEHALSLLLASAKNIVVHTTAMRNGIIDRRPVNRVLKGSALGILGFGNIGKSIAKIAKSMSMRIMAINTTGRSDFPCDFMGTLEDLPTLLSKSDFLVISLPLTNKTAGLIGREQLMAMKKNAILVNVSRGGIVRERDLYQHLKENPDFRAAFDVWWAYPKDGKGYPFSEPFHELPNFIMTPHVGGHVPGHREARLSFAIDNMLSYLEGRGLRNLVGWDDYMPYEVKA